jgi:hypothetical protein
MQQWEVLVQMQYNANMAAESVDVRIYFLYISTFDFNCEQLKYL